ncbi:MAG: hypothetical protein B6I25_03665 [Planctomycetales bacterium 4572_13]|nr:MAG: hypothetical protein B6I25_03665 [Planctomycetales bacterium 4572_13]
MKKLVLLTMLCGLMSLACAGVETFDGGSEGWNYGYGLSTTSGNKLWRNGGGNPGAHLSGSSNNLYKMWTHDTESYGGITGATMTVDTKIKGVDVTGAAQLYIGRENTYYVSSAWNIALDIDWTTHQFNTADFTLWPSGGNELLGFVTEIPDEVGVFFGTEFARGNGKINIDNFGFIPEPATLLLLGMGGFLTQFGR